MVTPRRGLAALPSAAPPPDGGAGRRRPQDVRSASTGPKGRWDPGSWEAACASVNNLLIIDSSGRRLPFTHDISIFALTEPFLAGVQWKPLLLERWSAAIGTRSLPQTSSPDILV